MEQAGVEQAAKPVGHERAAQPVGWVGPAVGELAGLEQRRRLQVHQRPQAQLKHQRQRLQVHQWPMAAEHQKFQDHQGQQNLQAAVAAQGLPPNMFRAIRHGEMWQEGGALL